jgi:diazepam-binding inhibitor (GABA receptor modulating acyl-CoA-binding protein)
MTLQEQFEAAVTESKLLTARPDNDTLLKIYSLYKQATEGDAPDDGPTNPFDFIAKAKYNAWSELVGLGSETAKQQYIDLINKLKG